MEKLGWDNSEITLNQKEKAIDIGGNWKNRDEWFQKFCYIISLLDKECSGHIDCRGEDNEDVWYIEFDEGNVEIYQGRIEYDMVGNFKEHGVKKMVYDLSKDEELGKEIMLDTLERDNVA
jgi:hypothetical protein